VIESGVLSRRNLEPSRRVAQGAMLVTMVVVTTVQDFLYVMSNSPIARTLMDWTIGH